MNIRWLLKVMVILLCASVPSAWAQRSQELPRDVHGLWFDPGDPGWATAVFEHESAMSTALLIYDGDGRSTWAIAPRLDCYREQPPWLLVECSGKLYKVTASWFGTTFRPSETSVREAGEFRGDFTTPLFGGVGPTIERRLDVAFLVDGWGVSPHGQKPLKIQKIDPLSIGYLWQDGSVSGLWGNPNESGWGVGISVMNRALFATLFVHGPDRQPRWYVIVGSEAFVDEARPDRTFEGKVFETTGFPRETNRAGNSSVRQVGSASVHFGAVQGDPASLSYSIDGVQVSKTIRRH